MKDTDIFEFDASTGILNGMTEESEQLTEINIPEQINGVKVIAIEWTAFGECPNLKSITIPGSIRWIAPETLQHCDSLTDIYFGGTEEQWDQIEQKEYIGFDPSTTKIHFNAGGQKMKIKTTYRCEMCGKEFDKFTECDEHEKKHNAYNGVFEFNPITGTIIGLTEAGEQLTEITIPEQINGVNVTAIGNGAFYNCWKLTSITIPGSITSIKSFAFRSCHSLTSITIPEGVTSIGDEAFKDCNCLESITIPASVTSIGDGAFRGCSSLESVTISEGVTSIGKGAFSNCTSLESITIPESVTWIGNEAFEECYWLKSVTIPESVTYIGAFAFADCDNLKSVIIPESVTRIGVFAFKNCRGLEHITIPRYLDFLGENCFYGCENLQKIQIGSVVIGITCRNDNEKNHLVITPIKGGRA